MKMTTSSRATLPGAAFLFILAVEAPAQAQASGDSTVGKTVFQQNCALCHSDALGAGNTEEIRQGPSLVGVVGRKAGTEAKVNYSQAMKDSGLTWDAPTLDRFLMNPPALVPGTTMPISVPSAKDRADVIAYLATLKMVAYAAPAPAPAPAPVTGTDSGDWRHAAPGVKHRFTLADLPAPFATSSVGNAPRVVDQPDTAALSVPPGFTVKLFASGFSNPRLLRVAPNGDIFVAETAANRIRVLRAADGADAPAQNQVFVEGLNRPFGISFYPPGPDPQWMYVANNNSVVRLPYHNGDLAASGPPQVIVPQLTDSHGGHSTRDVVFSRDGKRMFIAVGSGSNVAETMSDKEPADAQSWEKDHGLGAGWDQETNRADVMVTDPEGHEPIRTFATGIRNGVELAIDPATGVLWTCTNERDGLGDDLVPDYITSVREHGFYGWPWYYLGSHEDPRHAGERPDLRGKAIVPDVLIQSHSAPLGLAFYTATNGAAAFPADYRGDIFCTFHGSWNRATRTGYKLVRVRFDHGKPTGEYDDFLTGFVVDDDDVWGRPVGVTVAHDGALLMTEDGRGTIWRIAYIGH